MKTILALLKAGQNVSIGGHEIIAYSDGKSIGIRLAGSLTSGTEKITMTGLRRLLKWMDTELADRPDELVRDDERERMAAVTAACLAGQPPHTLQLTD